MDRSRTVTCETDRAAVGMRIPMRTPTGMGVGCGYGNCDESQWACGDSMEIFEWTWTEAETR